MNRKFDYVKVTLSDGSTREGQIVQMDGFAGTVSDGRTNTAFYVPAVEIEIEIPGTDPVKIPSITK